MKMLIFVAVKSALILITANYLLTRREAQSFPSFFYFIGRNYELSTHPRDLRISLSR